MDASAKQFGAITRKRNIQDAETLLRLGLAYGMGSLPLRETVARARLNDAAELSDVALLKRLRNACDWFGWLVAQKLAPRTGDRAALPGCGRLRLLDATTVSRPGSVGTDWRLHVGFDLHDLRIDHVEITDAHGGETLTRLPVQKGDLMVYDLPARDAKASLPAVTRRLVALRKSREACQASRSKVEKQARKKGKPCPAASLEAAE